VRDFNPDVVCAHSLGSLASYDAFIQLPAGARNRIREVTYLTFGSQIGNPFVRAQFGGRIVPLPCRRWFHLFNAEDDVFTARIRLQADGFEQVDTLFDLPDPLDHDAGAYLQHANTVNRVWASIAGGPEYEPLRAARQLTRGTTLARPRRAQPGRRALLVGINQYPDVKDRLEGCVNDVYQVSAMLQECGFEPDDIRVVLDDRATASGIRSRLQWLLEDAGPGDQRVFFYSGHGAQLPEYAPDEVVDRVNECLVPWDFDWTPERAITDDFLTELYAQLDYSTHFLVMLDCCHSGGMTRDGGVRVRGLNPPDDIRHRELKWNVEEQMWQERKLPSRTVGEGAAAAGRAGERRDTVRVGRAAGLRLLPRPDYRRIRTRLRHKGPYMPVILQACGESELAYEYRDGVTSYGAFTFAVSKRLRRIPGRPPTFAALCKAVGGTLTKLGFEQHPEVDGPDEWVNAAVPWVGRSTAEPKKPRPRR
jgi:hypothetical protein